MIMSLKMSHHDFGKDDVLKYLAEIGCQWDSSVTVALVVHCTSFLEDGCDMCHLPLYWECSHCCNMRNIISKGAQGRLLGIDALWGFRFVFTPHGSNHKLMDIRRLVVLTKHGFYCSGLLGYAFYCLWALEAKSYHSFLQSSTWSMTSPPPPFIVLCYSSERRWSVF